MPGFGSLAQTPDEPYPEEGVGMPETYQSPAGRALVNLGVGLTKAIWDIPRKLGQAAEVPAGLRREDVTDIPVRHGITGTNQFGSEPQDELVEGTTGSAINRIGTGLPFAPRGVGAFGGRLVKPAEAAPPPINWDRATVSGGRIPVRPEQTVIDVDPGAVDRALKATDPSFYLDQPKKAVVDYMGAGKPVSLAEIHNYQGQLRFTNGRNRARVAADRGDETMPVAVDRDNEAAVRQLLAQHASPYEGWHEAMEGIRAYHGSPHDFDRFDASKIGTGEGAQAYGHGLYFAENEGVAKSYRDALTNHGTDLFQKPDGTYQVSTHSNGQYGKQTFPTLEEAQDFERKFKAQANPGHMYEVDIKADPEHFLDWDKPLSGHPLQSKIADMVRKSENGIGLAERAASPESTLTGQELVRQLARPSFPIRDNRQSPWKASGAKTYDEALAMVGGDKSRVNKLLTPDPAYTSEALREVGIPGIKYLDQGSRVIPGQVSINRKIMNDPNVSQSMRDQAKADLAKWESENGSHNYVVFDDKLINILRKYGWAGLVGSAGLLGGKDSSKEM